MNESFLRETALIIQPDWERGVKEATFKFFVGVREPGEKSEFHNVVIDTVAPDEVEIRAEDKTNVKHTLAVNWVDRKGVRVSVSSGPKGDMGPLPTAKFVSPTQEYYNLHKHPIVQLEVSTSGSMLLTADSMGEVKVSRETDGTTLRIFEGIISAEAARFFPSGLVTLTAGLDMRVKVYSVETGDLVRDLIGHKMGVTSVDIIGVGREVVSCSKDGTAKKWHVGRGECDITWAGDAGEANCIRVSPDQHSVLVGYSLGKLCLFDMDSTRLISTTTTGCAVTSVSFNSDGSKVVAGMEDGSVATYNVSEAACLAGLRTDRGRVQKVVWRREGIFASFGDGTVCLYDQELSKPFSEVEFSGSDCDPVFDFTFHDEYVYTASRDKLVRKYKVSIS